jgi:hypothetical protein
MAFSLSKVCCNIISVLLRVEIGRAHHHDGAVGGAQDPCGAAIDQW